MSVWSNEKDRFLLEVDIRPRVEPVFHPKKAMMGLEADKDMLKKNKRLLINK